MIEFISSNSANIIFVCTVLLIVGIALAVMWKCGRKKQVKAFILKAVVEAEKIYGSKTGQIKFNAVVSWFYDRYPLVGLFISKDTLKEYIQEGFDKLEEILSQEGVTLLSYSEEQRINALNAANATYTEINTEE